MRTKNGFCKSLSAFFFAFLFFSLPKGHNYVLFLVVTTMMVRYTIMSEKTRRSLESGNLERQFYQMATKI